MKKQNNHIGIFLALFIPILLNGCLDELDMPYSRLGSATDQIGFMATINQTTTKAETRYNGYVAVDEEDWLLEGQTVPIKGSAATALTGSAGLIGFVYDGSWSSSYTPWYPAMYNTEYSFGSVKDNNEYDLTSDSPIPWRNVTTDYLRVYAYAPYGATGITSLSSYDTPGVPTLTYTVPAVIASQTDLLSATQEVPGDYCRQIPLSFNHALTAIRFKVDFACMVKELRIDNVYETGTYKIGGTTSSDWTDQISTTSYTLVLSDSGISKSKGDYVADEANTLMLIPQTLPAGAQVYIKFIDTEDSKEYTITAPINGSVWQPGKRLTYTIAKNPTYGVYLDLALGDVTITPTGYRGYIHKNTGGSMSTMEINKIGTLTTEQVKALKFYVFQSNDASSSSPGYHKGYTGELSVNADGSFAPAVGSVLELPDYPEVRCDGKSWSEYITNNPNSAEVINNWNLSYSSGSNKGAAAGRQDTANKIYIYHPTVNDNITLAVDITIDNLWSSAYAAMDGFATAYGGITVGTHVMATTGSGESLPDTWTDKMDVTLRLKGDNRFKTVQFSTPNAADKFYITSADGDNSTKGSMTVMPSTSSEWVEDGGLTSMRFRSSRSVYAVYYHHGFKIKGGTIYTASSVSANNLEYSFFPCLGAGRNSCIEMEISGGSVTSVAHGTSAAIGAGGGFNGSGGNADITISGGKVYAYHFGVDYYNTPNSSNRYKTINHPLPSTAIGGGSTFQQIANSAVVRILGDAEVYAQSVGGVAIGGGSSCGGPGGNGEVYISGNAKVTAKSISGAITNSTINALPEETRRNYTVPAGTSIGGGKAGWYDLSYEEGEAMVQNGGNAVVSISGMSKTLAGSIGGGDAGVLSSGLPGKIGTATIVLTNAEVQGQFVMQAGSDTPPSFTMNSGTLFRNSDPTFEFIKEDGGAVYIGPGTNPGRFTMLGGTIKDFTAARGGVLYMEDGEVSISGGTIDNSTATDAGGAIYIDGGEFTMSGGTIRGCSSSSHGGALYVSGGDVTISSGSITDNRSSTASGGGIYVNNGNFSMSAGTVSGNYAATYGGGVSVSSEASAVTVNITGGNIISNSSGMYGGGLSVVPGGGHAATVNLGVPSQGDSNPNISGNNATHAGGGVYASGAKAAITINSGRIIGNTVSALVDNPDVANDGGLVTLNDGNVTHVVVTYHMNDGSVPETTATQKIVTATRSILSMPSWSISGYSLTWSDNPSAGLGTLYTDGQEVNLTTGLHLYAKWTALP